MTISRVEKENFDWFEPLLPEEQAASGDQILGAIGDDGSPVAAAIISGEGTTANLKWLFVHPDYRRQGAAARLLWTAVVNLRKQYHVMQASWLSDMEGMDAFLKEMGFFISIGDPVSIVPVKELLFRMNSHGGRQKEDERLQQEVPTVEELSQRDLKKLRTLMKGSPVGLAFLGVCDKAYSFCLTDQNGEPQGCLLIRSINEDILQIDYLYSALGETRTALLIRGILERVKKMGLENRVLQFVSAKAGAVRFIEKIMETGERDVIHMHYGLFSME